MVLGAMLLYSFDQFLWDSTETKATNKEGVTIFDIHDGLLGTREHLGCKGSLRVGQEVRLGHHAASEKVALHV